MLEPRLVLAQTTGLFVNDPGAQDGYVLFSPNTSTSTYLMNKDGVVVNQWTSQYAPGLLGYLQSDGSLIRDAAPNGPGGNGFIEAAGAGGLLERFDWDGNKNWDFAYDSETVLAHHDFEIMPNGNILLIAWEVKSEAEATQAGRDPNLPGPGYLYPDHIVEVQPDFQNGGGTIVWEWHVWDHLVQQFDETKDNWHGATGVADHPELIDINFVSTADEGAGEPEDWTHANGIDYNAELDQIVLSVREFSEFWIIDHSTTTEEAAGHTGGNSGRGGDLLYRWGNPQAYDRGDADDRQLFYQHDSQWIPDGLPGAGHITVLNNGFGRPGTDFTQVFEIVPPIDENGLYPIDAGQPWGPALPVWQYDAPVGDFTAIISGAQRLPNGNTLIDYGVKGTFSEVTPEGVEVWRYVSPYVNNTQLGPEDPIPNLGIPDPVLGTLFANFTFQAIQYPLNAAPQLTSGVLGRHLFYNESGFGGETPLYDGADPGINELDDNAIAFDKQALLPGGVATFSNVSSYTKGINGVMFDIAGAPGTITLDDFAFRVGNNNSPDTWAAAPTPLSFSVRSGAGNSGADRVEIVWANNAIEKTWLQVTVLSNSDTGLPQLEGAPAGAGDVFYFGNAVANSGLGDAATLATVNTTDEIAARNNHASLEDEISIANLFDYNRDGEVTTADDLAARNNPTNLGNVVRYISLAAPPVATAGSEFGPVAMGLSVLAQTSGREFVPRVASPLAITSAAPAPWQPPAGATEPDWELLAKIYASLASDDLDEEGEPWVQSVAQRTRMARR